MPNPTLSSFSDLAQEKASQVRNCANEPHVWPWFEALFLEKFDGQDDRAQKAWAWCSTVGRRHMLREGSSKPFLPQQKRLADAPEWVRKAVAAGKPLTALSFAPEEREIFSSILDWMRSSCGPSLSSDWSKISVPQAKAAELAWIDAMAKAAAKTDSDAADAAGTTLFFALGSAEPGPQAGVAQGSEWAGWRWVEVQSIGALNREGSLMRHCVGSYAKAVASGGARIYSLRDPSNAPRLTIEAKDLELVQLKAFANATCPSELHPAVEAFAKAFDADATIRGLGPASASEELAAAGVNSLPGLGLAVGSLSANQACAIRGLIKKASEGERRARELLGAAAPCLAGLGLAADLAEILRFSNNPLFEAAAEAAARNGHSECLRLLVEASGPKEKYADALFLAARSGRAECLSLLIPVADPKAEDSCALLLAASNGHVECLKLLIPVSDAKALNSFALCRAAENGHTECVRLLIPVSNPNAVLEKVAGSGHVECLKLLIPASTEGFVEALCAASVRGHIESVKLLIAVCDPRARRSLALHWAASNGHVECVKLLMPLSDPKAEDSLALRWAARNGHAECVKLLIPVSDLKARNSEALRLAAGYGHDECLRLLITVSTGRFVEALCAAAVRGYIECVKLLIPVCDPKAEESKALRLAADNGHEECVKLLLSVCDQKAAMPKPCIAAKS